MTNFKNDLGNLTWINVLNNQDVDDCFEAFWSDFSTLYELHFPLTSFNFNKNIHSKNDFMTPGLLISRLRKAELHKKSLIDPLNFSLLYKQYRNIYNSTIRASKKLYYDLKFDQTANNPKKTWELLNEITCNKPRNKNANIPLLNSNGRTLTSSPEIAEEFNSFFARAGQDILNSVPPTSRTPESYLNRPEDNMPDFELGNTTSIHVHDIIKSFKNKSSVDIDGISLKLLKFVSVELSTPLAHVFDRSFSTGIFPSRLKTNRTVPIPKSGDLSLCNNYSPISLIPTLSKIIEKMVSIKLTNFLQLNKLLHVNQFGFQRNLSTEHNM
jgi:hypothetical protein